MQTIRCDVVVGLETCKREVVVRYQGCDYCAKHALMVVSNDPAVMFGRLEEAS